MCSIFFLHQNEIDFEAVKPHNFVAERLVITFGPNCKTFFIFFHFYICKHQVEYSDNIVDYFYITHGLPINVPYEDFIFRIL